MNEVAAHSELTKRVIVFRTGHLIYFDWACSALKQAKVPFFTQEENSGGLRLAMPVAPSTKPGISWAALVPESAIAAAQKVLSQLPVEVGAEAGIWDFNPSRKAKVAWKICIIFLLALLFVGAIIFFIKEARMYG
jgi:hypothetical protein